MPIVEIKVIEDVFTHDEKREAVERITEALLDTWGEGIRNSTHVLIVETASEEWAVGGKALTSDDVRVGMLSR